MSCACFAAGGAPGSQLGAIKLAQRYGDALICVRYRHDAHSSLTRRQLPRAPISMNG